jgi:hypothetical protein
MDMKASRFTEERIIGMLAGAGSRTETGRSLPQARKASFYNWKMGRATGEGKSLAARSAHRDLRPFGYSSRRWKSGPLVVPLQRLKPDDAVRARVAIITGLAVLAYVITVYLIFFLTYTPLNIDHVRGVQGRYFVIALPMAAIFFASMINIDLTRPVLATTAITGSFSGIASFQVVGGTLVSAVS